MDDEAVGSLNSSEYANAEPSMFIDNELRTIFVRFGESRRKMNMLTLVTTGYS